MMIRKILTASIASGALAIAGPALAGPGHGGGHGGGVGVGANANAGAQMGTSGVNANVNAHTNTGLGTNPAIGVSQGPNNASINGIANANSHSVLAGGAVSGSTLTGITTGMTVTNANNTNIGTISQIVTDRSGNIRLVVVTDTATGQTFRLAPNTLAINGTMVTTTSTVGG